MAEPTPTPDPTGGRRRAAAVAGASLSPLTILALVIPLLTVAALALVRPADPPVTSFAPTEADLDRATAVCPARLPGADDVTLGNTALASGDLALRVGGEDSTEALEGGVATLTERAAVVVSGADELASGLVVSRAGAGSATVCAQPAPEKWFTGVGAAAEHFSTLTLVNPDKGPAVADVTVYDGSGIVDVPALRGVRVPGGRSASFDLADVVPSRDALALRVSVSRGRLGASVVDVVDPLGRAKPVREWLPAQPTPAESSYVVFGEPGTAAATPGSASRVLTVANPGDSEVRLDIKLVSQDSEFTPAGIEELSLPPESVQEVDLGRVLRGKVAEDVQALRLDATAPITASLRTRTTADLALAAAGAPVESATGVALPEGAKRVVLAGAGAPGVVILQAWNADGEEVVHARRVEIDPATAGRIKLPDDTVLALIRIERTSATISVELADRGLSVLPLDELVTTGQLPDVRPAQR